MKKLILTILAFWTGVATATTTVAVATAAQGDVTFEVAAPTAVEAGELFRIEFVVNAIRGIEFTPPTIEGFEVLAGPSMAVGANVAISGGQSVRVETTTYTAIRPVP